MSVKRFDQTRKYELAVEENSSGNKLFVKVSARSS